MDQRVTFEVTGRRLATRLSIFWPNASETASTRCGAAVAGPLLAGVIVAVGP